jgi:hypothetical protein
MHKEAWLLLAEIAVTVVGVAAVLRWRWGVIAILLYLPVQGMVANLLYPDVAALLLLDTLIGATYLGFVATLNRGEQRWLVPREFMWAFALLAAVCTVQTFNPQLANPLVALVGFRVLLLFIPLFVIGMSLAQRSPLALDRLTWLVLIISLPVCLFGIWEWFQGPSAVAALGPGFARSLWIIGVESGTLVIYRPSSTFAFVGQFSEYLLFVTVLAFGALHATRQPRKLALLAAAFVVAVVAVLLAGGRTIWFVLPVLAVAMYAVYLIGGRLTRVPPAVPVIAVGTVIGIAVGLPILRSRLPSLARTDYLLAHLNNFNPFHPEFFTLQGLIGHGTGAALGAARYFNGGYVPNQFEGGWYIPLYMFGVLGLVVYLFLYGVVLRLAWFGLRSMTGDRRWLGAAIFCYLAIIALLEGAVNYPPANVFFWLFAGLLAGQAVAIKIAPPAPAGQSPANFSTNVEAATSSSASNGDDTSTAPLAGGTTTVSTSRRPRNRSRK